MSYILLQPFIGEHLHFKYPYHSYHLMLNLEIFFIIFTWMVQMHKYRYTVGTVEFKLNLLPYEFRKISCRNSVLWMDPDPHGSGTFARIRNHL